MKSIQGINKTTEYVSHKKRDRTLWVGNLWTIILPISYYIYLNLNGKERNNLYNFFYENNFSKTTFSWGLILKRK